MTAPIEHMGDGVPNLCHLRSAIRASLPRLLTWVRLLAVLALPLPAITAADPAIHSGELHSTRIPREHWQHRLQMAKAFGLNTVSTYVFWSQHEPEPGKFDWTGQNDIAEFCRQAQREGLQVLIRPGPYVCGEYDFGGLPWWLLKDRDMRVRSRHPGYLSAVRRYYRALGEQLAPLQVSRGGPIAMVQVENEYDGHGGDDGYIEALAAALRESGFDVPLYTSEMTWALQPSKVPGLIRGVGFSRDPDQHFAEVRRIQPTGPLFCSELYTGWYDVWGRGSSTVGPFQALTNTLERVLDLGASFNLYMVHGGTSFGFTSGANDSPYRPQPTSYDYGAPIDEAGRPTAKYFAIREVMSRHLPRGQTLPPLPPSPRMIALPRVQFSEITPVLKNLPSARVDRRAGSVGSCQGGDRRVDQPHPESVELRLGEPIASPSWAEPGPGRDESGGRGPLLARGPVAIGEVRPGSSPLRLSRGP
jgi:beta-galactosidase